MNRPTDVFKRIDMHGGNTGVCWEWKGSLAANKRPYFHFDGKREIAYRLVYRLVTGHELSPEIKIRHKCDNPICCNPHHLTHGTHAENMEDMKTRERHGLTHHMVRVIKRLLATNQTQQSIADLTGVSRETISAIATGRVYSHVELDGEDE